MRGTAARVVVIDDPLANCTNTADPPVVLENPPPCRLSTNPNHPDYHPSFVRVGVRIDGCERNDLAWYDTARGLYSTDRKLIGKDAHAGIQEAKEGIEPYWRFPETRQQRRARERWEAKR